jgi:hypothetical protein
VPSVRASSSFGGSSVLLSRMASIMICSCTGGALGPVDRCLDDLGSNTLSLSLKVPAS